MNVEQALKPDLQNVLEPKMYKVLVMVTNEWIISMFRTVRRLSTEKLQKRRTTMKNS